MNRALIGMLLGLLVTAHDADAKHASDDEVGEADRNTLAREMVAQARSIRIGNNG